MYLTFHARDIESEYLCAAEVPEQELKVEQGNVARFFFREASVCEAVGEERGCGRNEPQPSLSVLDPLCRRSPQMEPRVAGWWSEGKRFTRELCVRFNI